MAAQHRLDEPEAAYPLHQPGHARRHHRLAALVLPHVGGEVAVDLREGLDEAFRVAGGGARGLGRRGGQAGHASHQAARGLAEFGEPQLVGLLLLPAQAATAAVDAQAQAVVLPPTSE